MYQRPLGLTFEDGTLMDSSCPFAVTDHGTDGHPATSRSPARRIRSSGWTRASRTNGAPSGP